MDDVRTLAAVTRRRRWAAQQVRRVRLRQRCNKVAVAMGITATDVAGAFRRLATAYGDADIAAEIDAMWEDA